MMAWYGVAPQWWCALVPFLMLGLVIAALGVGTLLAALTVTYRDFRHVVPFLVQFWMFATPCIYLQREPAFGAGGRLLLAINPALRPDRQFPCGAPGIAPESPCTSRLRLGRSDPADRGLPVLSTDGRSIRGHHLTRILVGSFSSRLIWFERRQSGHLCNLP